jgi:hypothetical protein
LDDDPQAACVESFGCQAIWENTTTTGQGIDNEYLWLGRYACNSGGTGTKLMPTTFGTRESYNEFSISTTFVDGAITDRDIEQVFYDDVFPGVMSDPDQPDTVFYDLYPEYDNSPLLSWRNGIDGLISTQQKINGYTNFAYEDPTSSNYTGVLELKCTNTNHDGWNTFTGCCEDDAPASTGQISNKKQILCDKDCGNIQGSTGTGGCTWSDPAETAIHKGKVSFIAVKMNTSTESSSAVNSIEVRATRACKTGCTSGNTMCYKLTFNFWYNDIRLSGHPVSYFASEANKVFEKYGLPLEFVATRGEYWGRTTLDSSTFSEITFSSSGRANNADPCLARTNFGASGSGWHDMISTKTLKFNAYHDYSSGEIENIKFTATGSGGVRGGYDGCKSFSNCDSASGACSLMECGGTVGSCTSTTFVSIPLQGNITIDLGGSDTFTPSTLGTDVGCGCIVKWT